MPGSTPTGFEKLILPPSGYLDANGPFYAKYEKGKLTIGMRIDERHANSLGIAHGGLLMTLGDVILTIGSNIAAGLSRFLPTISATCDFIGAAKVGEWIEGEVNMHRAAKTHVFTSSLIRTAEGAPVARIGGVLVVRGEPDPRFAAERYFGRSTSR